MKERRAWTWRHLITKSDLHAITRHVLLTLSGHVNDAGEACYPSIEQLAQETGRTKQTVRKHLDIARKGGWIEVNRHGFSGQKWRTHEYFIAWPLDQKGAEGISPPLTKGAEADSPPFGKGAEPDSPKVGKQLQHLQDAHIREVLPNTSHSLGGEGFDLFWKALPQSPHKKGQVECLKFWQRNKLGAETTAICEWLARMARCGHWRKAEGRYIPKPLNLLRSRAWLKPALLPSAPQERLCHCGQPTFATRGLGPNAVWLCVEHLSDDSL